MRKIFIIDAPNQQVARELTDYVLLNKKDNILVPNIVFMSIYYDIDDYLKSNLIGNIKDRIVIIKQIIKLLFSTYKDKYIEYILNKIDDRDTPRTTLFIFCQNRILFHYVKKVYGHKLVKSLKIETDVEYIDYEANAYKFKKHDIKLTVPDWKNKELRREIINQFVNKHIPVKIIEIYEHI
jgi:hypothetical protein